MSIVWIILIIVLSVLFIASLCVICPIASVWWAKKAGEASLAHANFAEQIQIAEANARLKAAKMNKEADEIEAEAVANSIETIGDSLQKNDSYLRWQWIKMMDETNNTTIYVPTEANLPLLEARDKQ